MRIALLGLVALAAAGCVKVQTSGEGVDVDVDRPGDNAEVWNATLQGQANFMAARATARATVAEGQTTATATLTGGMAGHVHPWHIHEGDCGSGGPIVGPATAYPPLRPGVDGSATATARIGVALNETRDYHVNIHASPQELGTIMACGNLDD